MHIDNIIVKFEKLAKSISELANEIEQYKKESVKWSIEDFEERANIYENNLINYDPSKFQDALELMIEKHDATIGINWDTIQSYLDNCCLRNK